MEIKFLNPKLADMFKPETELSAGYDLRSMEELVLAPGETVKVSTGISIYMNNPKLCAVIMPRSGLGCKGIKPRNAPGLIDADYQGELIVCLHNDSEDYFKVNELDRIAQLVFMPVFHPVFTQVREFTDLTVRGTGGLGSTGKG